MVRSQVVRRHPFRFKHACPPPPFPRTTFLGLLCWPRALEEGLDSNSLEVQLRAALVSLGAATLAQIRSKLHSNPDDTELVNTLRFGLVSLYR